MTRIIFHIDVNSAYLSWTAISLLKKGEPTDLRTIPSIIGGSIEDRHGIVLAKSTPAKKHGIVTGEPIIQAMQKCPNLIAYPPDFALYSKCSRAMFDILSEYSDRIEPFSIDEGFLDYTGMEALFGPPIEAAKAIQKRILAELGFTVNIGISTNKLLAKMAGELEKPNKCITLFPEEIDGGIGGQDGGGNPQEGDNGQHQGQGEFRCFFHVTAPLNCPRARRPRLLSLPMPVRSGWRWR